MIKLHVQNLTTTRIPTRYGEFALHFYANNHDTREHLALVFGEVSGHAEVLVRIHSECYTGDVLGSQRCDCGEQLQRAMQMVAEMGAGVIVYLRQEGRGIGLLEKLRAYNLQDLGYDTVEANLMLGHKADERDYTIAARILEHLQLKSVQLLTNNPHKIEALQTLGIEVTARVALHGTINDKNKQYIQTKIERMGHIPPPQIDRDVIKLDLLEQIEVRLAQATKFCQQYRRSYVTLSYAQTLDGCIALQSGQPFNISNQQSYALTHQLRARHEAVLVGIRTVLSDNPQLTVRLTAGQSPQPIILDSHLRLPLEAKLLRDSPQPPWIFTSEAACFSRQARLEALGARVFRLSSNANKTLNLAELLIQLMGLGIKRLMVEGGARVITSFVEAKLVDQLVLTIAPMMAGGVRAVNPFNQPAALPQLKNLHQHRLGDDLIIRGDVTWPTR